MRTVRAEWTDTVLICRKCSKKLDGGFGPKGKTPLAKALRQELAVRKGRKGSIGIVDVKCLGICPRGAVTVVTGAAPGDWALVNAGAPIAEVVRDLGLNAKPVTALPESGEPEG